MNKDKTLVIIGAGGHGRVVADCAEASNKWTKIVFLDDGFPGRKNNLVWPIINRSAEWRTYIQNSDFIIAIGDNQVRLNYFKQLSQANCNMVNIIHPSAIISQHSTLGKGNAIFANTVINPGTVIGNANIINTAATIDHDCELSDGIHISPGAHIAGTVHIKNLSWVGIGANIIQGMTLAENTQIGGGACVTSSTKPNSLYVGVPAKRIKSIK